MGGASLVGTLGIDISMAEPGLGETGAHKALCDFICLLELLPDFLDPWLPLVLLMEVLLFCAPTPVPAELLLDVLSYGRGVADCLFPEPWRDLSSLWPDV